MNLFTLLGVVFIVLKLTGYIVWSWILVLAPIWAPLILVLIFAIWQAVEVELRFGRK